MQDIFARRDVGDQIAPCRVRCRAIARTSQHEIGIAQNLPALITHAPRDLRRSKLGDKTEKR